MAIARNMLTLVKLHSYVTEASTLGFPPGRWPASFEVPGLGNGQPFMQRRPQLHNGEILLMEYFQCNGCIDIKVYND